MQQSQVCGIRNKSGSNNTENMGLPMVNCVQVLERNQAGQQKY
jgi:hypothetical protein